MKALKKPLKYGSGQYSGPLLERKVDTNESLIYYTRRYCAIKEKRPRRRPQIDSSSEDLGNDAILGLWLAPAFVPEARKHYVPRMKTSQSNDMNSRNKIKHSGDNPTKLP